MIGVLCLLFLAACSGQGTSSSSGGEGTGGSSTSTGDNKVISIGIMNKVGSINPLNAVDQVALHIVGILFENLYDVNEDMEFVPRLVESFETEDNQTFTITLQKDANWSDGQPFTTEDVLFTLNLMANPEVQSRGLATLNVIEGLDENGRLLEGETSIKGIEIIDEKTFTVTTKKPVDMNFLKQNLGHLVHFVPKHVLKDIEPSELHQHPFMENPDVTNGPFTLEKLSSDSFVELNANPGYYRGAPKIGKLFFKVMPAANLVAQLQTEEIHMNYPGVGNIAVQDFEKVKNIAHISTTQGKPYFFQMMYFNTTTISDPDVRRALTHAINRPLIVDNLLKGQGEYVDGQLTTVHPYYNKDIEKYEYDPEKAKKLLEKSGWDFSKPINLAVPTGNTTREQAAAIIAENLSAIGVKVQINKYDLPTLLQKGRKQEFDLLMLGLPLRIDPDRAFSVFYVTDENLNFAGYSNPKVDQLIEDARYEPNPENRGLIYDELQEVLHEDLPTITLYAEYQLGAVSKKIKEGEPKEFGMLYNVHEWDIE